MACGWLHICFVHSYQRLRGVMLREAIRHIPKMVSESSPTDSRGACGGIWNSSIWRSRLALSILSFSLLWLSRDGSGPRVCVACQGWARASIDYIRKKLFLLVHLLSIYICMVGLRHLNEWLGINICMSTFGLGVWNLLLCRRLWHLDILIIWWFRILDFHWGSICVSLPHHLLILLSQFFKVTRISILGILGLVIFSIVLCSLNQILICSIFLVGSVSYWSLFYFGQVLRWTEITKVWLMILFKVRLGSNMLRRINGHILIAHEISVRTQTHISSIARMLW